MRQQMFFLLSYDIYFISRSFIRGHSRFCDIITINDPCCQQPLNKQAYQKLRSSDHYLLVEAQGSQCLFNCCEAFPAPSGGYSDSRVLPLKASTKIPGEGQKDGAKWTKISDNQENKINKEDKMSPHDQCRTIKVALVLGFHGTITILENVMVWYPNI